MIIFKEYVYAIRKADLYKYLIMSISHNSSYYVHVCVTAKADPYAEFDEERNAGFACLLCVLL